MEKKIKKNRLFLAAFVSVFFSSFFYAEETAVSLYEKGLAEENAEDWSMASQHFMESVEKNPVYADAWFHLASCSYQLGEYELVLSELDEAEKYRKDDSHIPNLRGMTFIALERLSDAKEQFQNVLNKYPNNIDARFGLAELELFDGRVLGAEKIYLEALGRQSDNRKALLSLAVVSIELGKIDLAKKYVNQALSFYSGECEIHYFASIIYAMLDDLDAAEKQIRIALEINGNYDKAYDFLSKIRFAKKDYDEVISICDFRIGRNRDASSAWYLKGLSLEKKGKNLEAIEIWSKGLDIFPEDEIMRAAMEQLVAENIQIEDARRKLWAMYHVEKARECKRRYDSTGATFQYQMALKIDPSNEEARSSYAAMLELNGMHELYLDQLLFIRENRDLNEESENIVTSSDSSDKSNDNASSIQKKYSEMMMDNTIEAYESLLQDSLANKWNVQPFYLDKTRWKLGVYYTPSSVSQLHPENARISAEFASQIFSGIASAAVQVHSEPVKGFGDAYQKARSSKSDYFVILSFDEGSRDMTMDFSMYSGRTGYKIFTNSFYTTGNDRFSNIFRRFRKEIMEHLPVRGKIISREGKRILIDMGKSENLVNGAVFDVVKKGSVETSGKSGGIVYSQSDVLGLLTVTTVGEEVSEGLLEYNGFYDKVNANDEVVLISMPKTEEQNASGGSSSDAVNEASPAADVNGNAVNKVQNPKISAQELGKIRTPSYIDLIRSIY